MELAYFQITSSHICYQDKRLNPIKSNHIMNYIVKSKVCFNPCIFVSKKKTGKISAQPWLEEWKNFVSVNLYFSFGRCVPWRNC